jgi:iron complex outermembrane receptor protein
MTGTRARLCGCAVSALAFAMLSTPAMAQVAAASPPAPPPATSDAPQAGDAGQDIVVTGTLIRGTRENGALPVNVISSDELDKQGSPSPVELLKSLPTSSGVLGDSNQFDSRSQGTEGIATVNLRGLGPQRTLVLLDSKRIVNVGQGVPAVDINLLPLAAIGRVEVLKDGAAATYGSDAVGGVVNFITRDDQQGFVAAGDYKFIRGSQGDYTGSLSYGYRGNGLSVLLAAGYQHRSELLTTDRSFADKPFAYNPEDGFTTGGDVTAFRPITATGATVGGAVVDSSCTAVGGQLTYTGTLAAPVANGRCYTHAPPYDALTDTENRFQLFAKVGVDLTDSIKFEATALWGHSDLPHTLTTPSYLLTQAPSTSALPAGTSSIAGFYVPASNPGLILYRQQNPGAIPATAAGVVYPLLSWRPFLAGGNPVGRDGSAFGVRKSDSIRFTASLSGKVTSDINWDTSFTYSDYTRFQSGRDEFGDRVQLALRGLGGPNCNIAANTPGQNGCQYFNPFGNGIAGNPAEGLTNPAYSASVANSNDVINWFYVPFAQSVETQLYVGEASISGKTGIHLPGGDLAFAVGGQYRKTKYDSFFFANNNLAATPCRDTPINGNTVCSPSVGALGFKGTNNNGSFSGDVKAAFVELQAPIFDRLDLQLAARYEAYGGGVGSTFNPKATARFKAFDWLAFRGSVGTTFRGPPDQLVTAGFDVITQSIGGAFRPVQVNGNPALKPEKATNFSGGVAVDVGRFHFTADYWRYKLRDIIVAEPAPLMATALFANAANCTDPAFAALKNRFLFNDGGGVPGAGTCALTNIQRVQTFQTNSPRVGTSGIDVQFDYVQPDVLGGRVGVGATGTYTLHYKVSDLTAAGVVVQPGYDAVGFLNGDTTAYPLPQFKGQAYVEYGRGIFNGRFTFNYLDNYFDQRPAPYVQRVELLGLAPNAQNLNGQRIGSYTTVDFSLRAQLRTGTTVNLTVQNLTDRDPPLVRLNYNYDSFSASALGRQFKIGVSQKF